MRRSQLAIVKLDFENVRQRDTASGIVKIVDRIEDIRKPVEHSSLVLW